jgi:hypothetical protein
MGRERLPGVHDSPQAPRLPRFDQSMNMVGHNTPGNQPVSHTFKDQKSLLNHRRNPVVAKPTRPIAGILILRDKPPKLDLPRVRGREVLLPTELSLPALNHRLWDSIMQPERQRLDQKGLVEVRKVSAGPPRLRLRSPWDRRRPTSRIFRWPVRARCSAVYLKKTAGEAPAVPGSWCARGSAPPLGVADAYRRLANTSRRLAGNLSAERQHLSAFGPSLSAERGKVQAGHG